MIFTVLTPVLIVLAGWRRSALLSELVLLPCEVPFPSGNLGSTFGRISIHQAGLADNKHDGLLFPFWLRLLGPRLTRKEEIPSLLKRHNMYSL